MFRAYDAEQDRLVAVKLFRLDLPPERVHQLVGAFERLIASDLVHTSLATPVATGISGVSAYLAVENVEAESLDLAVREYGPAPPLDAVRVATQLAAALDFAAVVDVVHGAMHPRDILLSAVETRITGIGVARALESVGVTPPIRRPYTAPERVAGRAWDRRADIFSLAALAHELLWGRRITGSGDHVAEALTDLPGARLVTLQTVFARALSENPDERFETALAFAGALTSAFELGAHASAPEESDTAARTDRGAAPTPLVIEPKLPLEAADVTAREALPRSGPTGGDRTTAVDAPADARTATAAAATQPRVNRSLTTPKEPAASVPRDDIPIRRTENNPDLELRDAQNRASEGRAALATFPPEPEPGGGPSAPSPIVEKPVERAPTPPSARTGPVAAALLIGIALGFAGGYGFALRDRSHLVPADVPAAQTKPATPDPLPPAATAPTAEREATDVAVTDAQKPVAASGDQPAAQPPAERPSTRIERRTPSRVAAESRPARSSRPAERPSVAAPSGTAGRFVGGLSVDSRPTGARVFVDGRLIGTTPLVVASVPAGEHAIRIERDGYRRWSSSIRIVASEQNRVTASLER